MDMRSRYFGFLLAIFMLMPVLALSESDWPDVFPPKPEVRLVAAQTAIGRGRVGIGVYMRLGKEWKTYAPVPQETGLPPKFDWSGSQNLKSAQVRYPQPSRMRVFESEIIGYEDEVVFPVIINVEDRDRPLHVRLDLSYAICADLCVPLKEQFSLFLPPGAARASADRELIRRFIDKAPK